jgi:dienelactone hydrolase
VLHPRFGFWLFTSAALGVAWVALGGGWLRLGFGLPAALGLAWIARELRTLPAKVGGDTARAPVPERLPRRAVVAGVAALLLGVAWILGGAGLGGWAALLLGLAAISEGAQLSLEAEPIPSDLPLPSTRSARLTAAIAADEAIRFSWDLGGRISPSGEAGPLGGRLRIAAERSRAEGWLTDPAAAHPRPPALEKPQLQRDALRGLGAVEHMTFESEFEPFDPEARAAYLDVAPNRLAHAWLFRSPEPRPTLVCVHGYGGGRPALDARMFEVARLRERLGIDVALFVLPLHGARAKGRRSGAGFLDADPLWTNAAMGQAVWDLRRLAGWLRAQGAPVVGATGMSLGGYTTALWASLDDRLACAVPVIPAVRLSRIVWHGFSASRRAALDADGASEALLDEAWATHAPLRHRPAVAVDRALIVGGLADRICPPAEVRELWEHWRRPALHWFPGTHVGHVGRAGTRTALEAHLRRTLRAPSAGEAAGDISAGAAPLSRFGWSS